MIAICPAGPPKLMNPSLSQNLNASDSVGSAPETEALMPKSVGRARRSRFQVEKAIDER
jgi:hypothetical protein